MNVLPPVDIGPCVFPMVPYLVVFEPSAAYSLLEGKLEDCYINWSDPYAGAFGNDSIG